MGGDAEGVRSCTMLALEAAGQIADPEERDLLMTDLMTDLGTIPGQTPFW